MPLIRILELIQEVGFEAFDYLWSRGYRIIFQPVNIDILDDVGDAICRGTPNDIRNFTFFHQLSKNDKLERIRSTIVLLQTESNHIFDPDYTRAVLGVDIPPSDNGFSPDFRTVPEFVYAGNPANADVKIKLSGVRKTDERRANLAIGIGRRVPRGYTWHHLDDFDPVTGTCTMQLVKTEVHKKIFVTSLKGQIQPLYEVLITGEHTGGVAMWSRFL